MPAITAPLANTAQNSAASNGTEQAGAQKSDRPVILFPGFSNVSTAPQTVVFHALQTPVNYRLLIFPVTEVPRDHIDDCALIVTDKYDQVITYNDMSRGRVPILLIGDRAKLPVDLRTLTHIYHLKPADGEIQQPAQGDIFGETIYQQSLVERINLRIGRILKVTAERASRVRGSK